MAKLNSIWIILEYFGSKSNEFNRDSDDGYRGKKSSTTGLSDDDVHQASARQEKIEVVPGGDAMESIPQ